MRATRPCSLGVGPGVEKEIRCLARLHQGQILLDHAGLDLDGGGVGQYDEARACGDRFSWLSIDLQDDAVERRGECGRCQVGLGLLQDQLGGLHSCLGLPQVDSRGPGVELSQVGFCLGLLHFGQPQLVVRRSLLKLGQRRLSRSQARPRCLELGGRRRAVGGLERGLGDLVGDGRFLEVAGLGRHAHIGAIFDLVVGGLGLLQRYFGAFQFGPGLVHAAGIGLCLQSRPDLSGQRRRRPQPRPSRRRWDPPGAG